VDLGSRSLSTPFFSGEGTPSLKVLNIDRGASRQNQRRIDLLESAVSPDRSPHRFSTDRSGKIEVWVANVDGSHPQQLYARSCRRIEPFVLSRQSKRRFRQLRESAGGVADEHGQRRFRPSDRPAREFTASLTDGKSLVAVCDPWNRAIRCGRTAIVPIDRKGPPRFYAVPRAGGPHAFQWIRTGAAFAFWILSTAHTRVGTGRAGGVPRQLTDSIREESRRTTSRPRKVDRGRARRSG